MTTSADYFTFNVNNSLLLVGQTGSGKSHLVHTLMKRYEEAFSSEELKYAIFDLKQIEFRDVKSEYLLFDLVLNSDDGFPRLEELASLSIERASINDPEPFVFICIEENDIACVDQERFDKAIVTINKNAKKANMKLVYSTSRPDSDSVSKSLLHSFELVLTGQLSDPDYDYLEVERAVNLNDHEFFITERL